MNIIRIFFEFLPLLLLFIGVPLFFVLRRRRLAKMMPEERARHRAWERLQMEMMDPTNPRSSTYIGYDRHDD